MPELRSAIDSLVAGGSAGSAGVSALLASLMIAAFIGLAVAWVYQRTHHGLSYSRGFTQSLVVLTMGATLLIFVIGDSLVTAFGLLGALAIVRFRNVLKDTRDTVYVTRRKPVGFGPWTKTSTAALDGEYKLREEGLLRQLYEIQADDLESTVSLPLNPMAVAALAKLTAVMNALAP